jgi:hypothetical protein
MHNKKRKNGGKRPTDDAKENEKNRRKTKGKIRSETQKLRTITNRVCSAARKEEVERKMNEGRNEGKRKKTDGWGKQKETRGAKTVRVRSKPNKTKQKRGRNGRELLGGSRLRSRALAVR